MTSALVAPSFKNIVAGVAGLLLALGLFLAVTPTAHAQAVTANANSLSEAQIQAVLGLLSAFDIDQATINEVNNILHGRGEARSTTSGTPSGTLTATPTTIVLGQSTSLHATFAAGQGDLLRGTSIDYPLGNSLTGITTNADRTVRDYVFKPSSVGTYTFYNRIATRDHDWATYGQVSVVVTSPSATDTSCSNPNGCSSNTSCSNPTGCSNTTVTPTCTLSASPSTITAGQSTTLTWTSTNATYASGPGGKVPANDSESGYNPSVTKTYTFAFYNDQGGKATCSTTVTVNPAATQPVTSTPPSSAYLICEEFNAKYAVHETGYNYILDLNGNTNATKLRGDTDGSNVSKLMVFENGKALGPAHTLHDDIRTKGAGRFSHWHESLYFSASDNSDPTLNGRTYAWGVPTGTQCYSDSAAAPAAPVAMAPAGPDSSDIFFGSAGSMMAASAMAPYETLVDMFTSAFVALGVH